MPNKRKKRRRPNKRHAAHKSAPASARTNTPSPPRTWPPFRQLKKIEAQRRQEIEGVFRDEFAFIDDCLALAARQVEILGDVPPVGIEDAAMRDLSCDAFEFLYEARNAISENRPSVVFPAMRRAFESISLCHLFTVKPEFSEAWSRGRKLSSADVRKQLEKAPLTESVEELRVLYQHFSQGTHPNRSHIPFLFLGEGNKFTLGAIPPVDPLNLGDHVFHLVSLSYWYVGVFLYFYGESIIHRLSAQFKKEFSNLTPRAKELQTSLQKALGELRRQLADEMPHGIGPSYLK